MLTNEERERVYVVLEHAKEQMLLARKQVEECKKILEADLKAQPAESVKARAIAALHTRQFLPEFIKLAENFIAAMPLEPRGYRCNWCGSVSCGFCGKCHMIDAEDAKPCNAYKDRQAHCQEWQQAYREVQAILQADAKKNTDEPAV